MCCLVQVIYTYLFKKFEGIYLFIYLWNCCLLIIDCTDISNVKYDFCFEKKKHCSYSSKNPEKNFIAFSAKKNLH